MLEALGDIAKAAFEVANEVVHTGEESIFPEFFKDMIEETVEQKGKILMRVPDSELFLLHLIMHQYKESCLLFMVERSKDLDLYKLADIYYLFKADIIDFVHLEELVEKHSLQQEIGTVLKQVGEVFMDEEIMCYANKFDSNVPIIIDYENKKN